MMLALQACGLSTSKADSDRQREASRTRTTRVDKKNTFAILNQRTVGVTGKNGRKPRGGRIETQFAEVMDHV